MKKKPVILCDADNTLVNLLYPWLQQYHEVGGEWIHQDDITSYHFENQVKDKALFLKVLKSGGIFTCAEPMYHAQAGLTRLQVLGRVYVVTKVMSNNGRAYDAKLGNYWRHFPTLDRSNVMFTGHKELIHGDYFIDDAPDNVKAWLKHNPKGHAFLIDWPYNRRYRHPRCTRVETVLEAAELIEERLK